MRCQRLKHHGRPTKDAVVNVELESLSLRKMAVHFEHFEIAFYV